MERDFPNLLKKFHSIKVDYDEGNGIDFEPYEHFMSEADSTRWIRS